MGAWGKGLALEIPGVTGVGVASMAAHCIRKLFQALRLLPFLRSTSGDFSSFLGLRLGVFRPRKVLSE